MLIEPDMEAPDIGEIELDLLLEAAFRRWGYDFRQYARGSLRRRVELARKEVGAPTMAAFQHRILHEREVFECLAFSLSVCVTALFRDPEFYRALRSQVLPMLSSYPYLKVWHAGCATGEEVYSTAILFDEAGLLERTTFYATDFNAQSLQVARDGIFSGKVLAAAQRNYEASGGTKQLSHYLSQAYESFRFNDRLRARMVFAEHNLVVDEVFSEVQLVVCRNVLIYFDANLQQRALGLFAEALDSLGVLALGAKESVGSGPAGARFCPLNREQRLYRKIA